MTEAGKKWYVVRAVSGQEKKVKSYIDNEIVRLNLQDHVSQVLVPTEKVFQIRNGKKVSKEKNYFPGYIMVEADMEGALGSEVEHTIKSIPGVIGFLGSSDKKAIPLRQQEVNRILGKVDELAEASEQINIPYIVGESVKVIDGPFNGFNGVIEEINEEKRKLKVMVKIFGRKTPLELSYMQVEKE
jgi:transcription termination/antitermination protein NusG